MKKNINTMTKEAYLIRKLLANRYAFKLFHKEAIWQCYRFNEVSAKEIAHYLRSCARIPTKVRGSKFKIDNTLVTIFANAFVQLEPKYKDKFVIKKFINLSDVLPELRQIINEGKEKNNQVNQSESV